MTTANLSVGIRTDGAKKSLLELKAWMRKEMAGVALSINDTALTNSVQAALRSKKFGISVNAEALRAEVGKALDQAFAHTHQVKIDTLGLTAQVKAAVEAGMGARLPGAVGGAVGGPDLKTTIQQILTPAVDELSKAAQALRAGARAAGAGAVGGRVTASSTFASTDKDTGERVAVRTSGLDPSAALAKVQEDISNQRLDQIQKEDERRLNQLGRESAAAFRMRQSARRFESQQAREEMADLQRSSNETFRARRAARRFEEIQFKDAVAEQQRDANETFRTRRAAQRFEEQRAKEDFAAMQRSSNETFRARRAAQRFEERQSKDDLSDMQRSANETFRARRTARRFEEQQARQEAARVFERARFDASNQYDGVGSRIAGARAVRDRFGDDRARSLLGNRDFLVDEVEHLDRFRKGADNAGASLGRMRGLMNDTHAAARGLAGSMGAIWLTWGSTAPLVAGAALGLTLRSAFKAGKDLEYQLAFVKVLSDGATVSLNEFGNAVRGSMVAPVEAAQAMRALAQNGLTAQEALQALPPILNLAVAGEMELAAAAYSATGVMAAFNLRIEDLGRIGDVFAKAAALSNTSVSAMTEAMKQASIVGDQYGVSLEETAASLAVMAKRNIEGTAAGTAFRNMLTEVAAPSKKAKEAMASLGVEVFNGNNQLKSFTDIIAQLKDKTAGLNEKGRLAFLNDLFDERGAKAANALLSDYELLEKTLQRLKNEAEGFTQSVTEGLAQTTEGKIKRLISEFQLSTSAAFNDVSSKLGNFVDQLRVAVGSQEFQNFLKAIGSELITLSRFLVEHHEVLLLTVGGWVAMRAALAIGPVIVTVVNAVKSLTTSLVTLRVAALGVAGALTGGVALIAALATEYLFLRSNADSATEAQRRFGNEVDLTSQAFDRSIQKLREENAQLVERNSLIRQGRDPDAAAMMADEKTGKQRLERAREEARIRLEGAEANAKLHQDKPRTLGGILFKGVDSLLGENKKKAEADKALDEARKKLFQTEVNISKFHEEQELKRTNKTETEQNRRLRLADEFNKRVEQFAKSSEGKRAGAQRLNDLRFSLSSAGSQDEATFKAQLEQRQKDLNKLGASYTPRDRASESKAEADARRKAKEAEREQHALDTTLSRRAIDEARQNEQSLRQQVRFHRELQEARYSEAKFGPYLASLMAEQRAVSETESLLSLETATVRKLEEEKNRFTKQSDKENIENEIRRREANIDLLKEEVEHRQELAKAKAAEQARVSNVEFFSEMESLRSKDDSERAKIPVKFDRKVQDPAVAARREAELAIENRYRETIAQHELKIKQAREGTLALQAEISLANANDVEAAMDRYEIGNENLRVEEARLNLLRQQMTESQRLAGNAAAYQAERAQTAQYGWEKFWQQYVENASSSAQMVETIMSGTMNGLEGMIHKFVMTGKVSFREFAASVTASIAQMMATQAMLRFAGFLMGAFGGGGGAVTNHAGLGQSFIDAPFQANLLANGGVMTSSGLMPLKRYSNGGIADRTQVAMYGEGRQPEAYVPLPDGRTIPVTFQGTGAGATSTGPISVSVRIDSKGGAAVESDVSGQKAAALGRGIGDAIRAVIVEEQRPGGLLYA